MSKLFDSIEVGEYTKGYVDGWFKAIDYFHSENTESVPNEMINLNTMNKTIWRFELKTTDNQTLKMPVGAEILTVQTQNEKPCLWALVDPNAEKEDRFIEIFGTGNPVAYGMGLDRKYISTYQLHGGSLVFHVFEYTGL